MLWILWRLEEIRYDENEAFVVKAPNETKARELANEQASDEGKIWTDPKKTACERLVAKKYKNGIVLRCFNAA